MPDIFLSYSRDDQAKARLVIQGLEREGFSVWWDQSLKRARISTASRSGRSPKHGL